MRKGEKLISKMMTVPFVVVVALVPAVALGWTDTFEDFDPNVTVQGQGDWYAYYGPGHALVEDEPGIAYAGTQYLDFFFTTYSTYPYRLVDEPLTAETAVVSYSLRIGDRFGTPNHDSYSRWWWSTGHYPPATMASTGVWDDGTVGYYTGAQPWDFVDIGVQLNPDEWYKFEYTYDLVDTIHWVVTRTADNSVAVDINFSAEVVNQTWTYLMGFNPATFEYGSGFHTLIDDLSIDAFVLHLPGDANGNGVVSAHDYDCVQANFGHTGEPWILGDANGDGVVSADDYGSVQSNFGNFLGGVAGSGGAGASAPEPTSLALLGLGGLTLLRRRRK